MTTVPHLTPLRPAPRRAYHPLVIVLAWLCVGIVCDRFLALPLMLWWGAAVIAPALCVVCRRRGWERPEVALLPIVLVAIGGVWHHLNWRMFSADDLGLFARAESRPACVEVIAREEPRRVPAPPADPLRTIPLGDRTRLVVEAVGIRDGSQWRSASGQAQLVVDGHLVGVRAGDRLRVFANLTEPTPARNPGEFDFAEFARADRQLCILRAGFPDAVTRTDAAGWSGPHQWIGAARARADRVLWRYLSPENAGLAAALVLGIRDELTTEATEAYFTTGTIHLLVVSGFNVAVLASVLYLLLRLGWTPLGPTLAAVAGLVIFYTFLSGAEPPVVRAAALVVLACVALYTDRHAIGYNVLAAAAIFVLVVNPTDLFRTGPQLSFLAVAVLNWAADRRRAAQPIDSLTRLIQTTRPWPLRIGRMLGRGGKQAVVISAIVWLVALPLLLNRFHLCSPAAIWLSPLLWAPVSLALLSGFALLLAAWVVPPFAPACAYVCDKNLNVMQSIVDFAQAKPGSYFWTPGPALWWVLGFYLGLTVFVALPQWRPPRRWMVGILAAWICVGVFPPLVRGRGERLECTFISVGHGCAVLMQLPGGENVLYDGGRLGSPYAGVRAISSTLWARGVTHLDAVVISHADADHYNALPELIERFSVGVVYVSPMMFEIQTPALDKLRDSIAAAGIPLREIWQGDRLRTGSEVTIDVLHPPRLGVLGSDNANSIVLAVEHQGRRMLLCGDLESPGLEDVMAEVPYDTDILLAPHHGSRRSDPPGFASWSTPDVLIISGGDEEDSREAGVAYAQVGAKIFHTAEVGAVHAVINDGSLSFRSWRD